MKNKQREKTVLLRTVNNLFMLTCAFLIFYVNPVKAVNFMGFDEDYFTEMWCWHLNPMDEKGENEYVLYNKARVDCVTRDYVIEFDWAPKQAEAIGQSLQYSTATGKRPGIVLLLRNEKDNKYWDIMQRTILRFNLPIQTWRIELWKLPQPLPKETNKDYMPYFDKD